MTTTHPSDMEQERKKQRALQRLGTADPQCKGCEEADWRCLELHHIAGQAYDDSTAIMCRNCHRKLSDSSQNRDAPANPPLLERVGRYLLGLASLFQMVATKLHAFGDELVAAAQHCPAPYGWIGETT